MKHLGLIGLVLLAGSAIAGERVIHQEKSIYRNILVVEDEHQRCMRFTIEPNDIQQACLRLDNPATPAHFYTGAVLSGLAFHPQPRKILVIGLGGGIISRMLGEIVPDAVIDSVEIDPAVSEVAKQFFGFRESPQQRVHIADGRVFIRRAALKQQQWDWVILDAFNADYIPEHLMTREFLEEVRAVLSEDGLLVANTFSTSRLVAHESATYANVFPGIRQVQAEKAWNRLLYYPAAGWPDEETLKTRITETQQRLQPRGINVGYALWGLGPLPDWPEGTRILTDQYAPVNLLKE